MRRKRRNLEYEEVYPKAYDFIEEARMGIRNYFEFYNSQRIHQTFCQTPDQIYFKNPLLQDAA